MDEPSRNGKPRDVNIIKAIVSGILAEVRETNEALSGKLKIGLPDSVEINAEIEGVLTRFDVPILEAEEDAIFP